MDEWCAICGTTDETAAHYWFHIDWGDETAFPSFVVQPGRRMEGIDGTVLCEHCVRRAHDAIKDL
jgi:hypothetical protein